jgi:hypothetical protein
VVVASERDLAERRDVRGSLVRSALNDGRLLAARCPHRPRLSFALTLAADAVAWGERLTRRENDEGPAGAGPSGASAVQPEGPDSNQSDPVDRLIELLMDPVDRRQRQKIRATSL